MDYQLKPEVTMQTVAGETVLHNPQSDDKFVLDLVGTQMLNEYQKSPDLNAVASAVTEIYDVSHAEAREDLVELLDKLVTEGLATKRAG